MISMIVKFVLNTLKICAFIAVVLVASHLIRWDGKTISDQVKTTLSSEEPKAWMKTAEKRTRTLKSDVQESSLIKDSFDRAAEIVESAPEKARTWIQAQKESANPSMDPRSHEDTISDTEKNELSSLIEE